MKEYLEIAQRYLHTTESVIVNSKICFTIKYSDLDNSGNPEQLILEQLNSVCYKFSKVKEYVDMYRDKYLMFYN